MTTFIPATKKASAANPKLSEQGIDFTQECHYTLDIFICKHKKYRKPRITHVGNCRYPAGTHKRTQCDNFAETPLVVYAPRLCPKCMPKIPGTENGWKEMQDKQGKGSRSVRVAGILVGTGGEAEKEALEGGDTDSDQGCEEIGPNAWTRVEENIPSRENGAAPSRKSMFQRIFKSFMSSPKATAEITEGTQEADKEFQAGWVEVEGDPDWNVIGKNRAK